MLDDKFSKFFSADYYINWGSKEYLIPDELLNNKDLIFGEVSVNEIGNWEFTKELQKFIHKIRSPY